MRLSAQRACYRATVDDALAALLSVGFGNLTFPEMLEGRFEADTRKARSHRIWFEGLVAILGFNLCLLIDCLIVNDMTWLSIVRRTALITPLAVLVNTIVRRNPKAWLRESSVAAGMFGICLINLAVEGNATITGTLFGAICLIIAALFVGVVMRLRFQYTLASLSAMLVAGLWSLAHARAMEVSEMAVADSMVLVGIGIILIASHSLEREERKSYLLYLQRDLQAEELALANEALNELSRIDNLTLLPNRRSLEERTAMLWNACAERGDPLSAVIIDVDRFKLINDVHGHLYGDEVLRRIGALLPQALRSPDDMAARFGGEEFVLLLPHAGPNVAMTVAERARRLIETAGTPSNPKSSGEHTMWVTVSCGVSSCLPGNRLQGTELFAAADEALYRAKRGGRNRVEFFECDDTQWDAFSEIPGLGSAWANDLSSTL
jgi:diguanylate cyclase (GGDEF)-like protein